MDIEWTEYREDRAYVIKVAQSGFRRYQIYVDNYYNGQIVPDPNGLRAHLNAGSIISQEEADSLIKSIKDYEVRSII